MSDRKELHRWQEKMICNEVLLLEETIAEKPLYWNIDDEIVDDDVRSIIQTLMHMVSGGD